jgi:hypothetical protein
LRAAEADLAVLLAESDVEEIGGMLAPGSAAAVLVWENTWAAPFGAAVRRSAANWWPAAASRPRPSWPRWTPTAPPKRKGFDVPLLRDRSDRPGLLGGRARRDDRGDRRVTGKTGVVAGRAVPVTVSQTIKRASSGRRRLCLARRV